MTIFEKRYPFATASALAGVSPKTVRNWLDRKQVWLQADDEREANKYRRFSIYDIARLAVTKDLVDFGMSVEGAALVAFGVFQGSAAPSNFKKAVSQAEITDRLRTRSIFAWQPQDGQTYGVVGGRVVRYGAGVPHDAPAALLSVDVARIAAEILQAAEELNEIASVDDTSADESSGQPSSHNKTAK